MEPGGSATEHKMMGQHHLTSFVASCLPLPPSGNQDPQAGSIECMQDGHDA